MLKLTPRDSFLVNSLDLFAATGDIIGVDSINKFGSSPSIDDAATWPVWDGGSAYTWPTTASITHARAAVDSAITRGVVIEVQGISLACGLVTQNVTLDGSDSTTEVALTTPLFRVFRMKVLDDTAMDQAIWVGATGFATKQAIIQAGKNQTLMAIYTIPAGKTGYVTGYYCDYVRDAVKDPDGVNFELWVRDNANGYAPQIKHQKGVPKQASGFQHFFKPYFKVNEQSDIFVTGNPDGAAAHCHAGFDIILIDNPVAKEA